MDSPQCVVSLAILADNMAKPTCCMFWATARATSLNLRTDYAFDGINYQARFNPAPGAWTTCSFALADFVPTWRGRPVPDPPPLDFAHVRQIGLMIPDRQGGPFALAIRLISVEIA